MTKSKLTTRDSEQLDLVLATHDGHHHADEIMACWLWHVLLDGRLKIVRTSDPRQIRAADIRVDCGKRYDPANGWWDHHWCRGLPQPPRTRGSGYSSVGLFWLHFGPEVILTLLRKIRHPVWRRYFRRIGGERREKLAREIAMRMEHETIVPIDAWDLGARPDSRDPLLPVQWVVGSLDFEEAMELFARAFTHRLAYLAKIYSSAHQLGLDLVQGGGLEAFSFGRGVLLVTHKVRVEDEAADRFARDCLKVPLQGLVSPTRRGCYCLRLRRPADPRFRFPDGLDVLPDRRVVMADKVDELVDTARSLSVFEIEERGKRDYNLAHDHPA